mmetsp:Transcript_23336/g.59026  ORF Transcript_23336/g.59026 Transcript_23336/m.59026 type:complete len:90 (-) Transcript_23336:44-313(-)
MGAPCGALAAAAIRPQCKASAAKFSGFCTTGRRARKLRCHTRERRLSMRQMPLEAATSNVKIMQIGAAATLLNDKTDAREDASALILTK